jgi:cell division septation protein DedD
VAPSTGTGAWVINLVSLPSQADADQFSARARSKGVHTEQQNVTVKGKKYWRVQITGFVTSEEAKSHSNSSKQKLGLKDVWIMKR